MLSHDVENERVANPWSRPGSDRTGSLAKGWSSGSAQIRIAVFFCPPALPLPCASWCPSQLGHRSFAFSSFAPSSHLHQGNSFPQFLHLPLQEQSSQKTGNCAVLPQILLSPRGTRGHKAKVAACCCRGSPKLHSDKTTLPGKLYL